MFDHVLIYSQKGDFLGYAIKKSESKKLHSMNIWTGGEEKDLLQQIGLLNSAVDIRNYWPDARDPDVQKILDDPTFEPIQYEITQVIDEENSVIVHSEIDPLTQEPRIDEEASILVYKDAQVPMPSSITSRIRSACEIVARERANKELAIET